MKKMQLWIFLAVQRLRLCTSIAKGVGSTPGQKIPHAVRCGQIIIIFF